MKITLKDIGDVSEVFKKIFNFPMSFKLSYRISKISTKIREEMKHVEEIRYKLLEKYGIKDEKNNLIKVPSEKEADFIKEFMEFLKDDTELNIQPIPYKLIEESKIELSPNEVAIISKFIEEEQKPEIEKDKVSS